ncbi:uncharacterized protein LOC131854650 [Achroia grisella]|uniref:uncharacterized protein LOC131854650 n=1 Tax=Achroia grisella TaxID=688607 RepID=UPI0027D20464|nr:uncharacterized protein LOC131854650 [Achroia grisella]
MKILFLTLLFFNYGESVILPSVPDHLVPCYRQGGLPLGAPRRLDVFISLLKKIEVDSKLDARLLSTSLLRSLRLDGIEEGASAIETEFVLPYRASAFQFFKYKLLMDLFLPTQELLNVDEILDLSEKCLMHKLLSTTVRRWERGDEGVVCPVIAEQRQTMVTQSSSRINSRCPIEEGVIQTEWGPITPGTIISAVAASLEFQRVPLTDILNQNVYRDGISEPLMASARQEWFNEIETFNAQEQNGTPEVDISNIWVATLAGDLAEVVINQGPRYGPSPQNLVVGTNNRWNDTLLPREHYLLLQNSTPVDWQITDAEILAGIDGLILAQYMPTWLVERRTLKISQVLEMYYSNEGVSFDTKVRACDRETLFKNLFNTSQIVTETSRLARVLSLSQVTVYVPSEVMDRISEAVVVAFEKYLPSVLSRYHTNCQNSASVPVMDLIVATDGSWKGYEVTQFMSWLGNALEINMQRSTLGLLHGNTGQWIVPSSHNMTTVFSHIGNFTDEWPNRLNIPNILSNIIEYSRNKTLLNVETKASAAPSTVVLIVSPSDQPSTADLERATSLMNSLRSSFFDVYFVYASKNLEGFQNINTEYLDYSEIFLQLSSSNVQDVIKSVEINMVKSEIPTSIMGVHCPFNGTVFEQLEYEDFVLPNQIMAYRIHPFYLRQQPIIAVQFRNNGQGELLVCTYRGAETSQNCQTLTEREYHIFNLTTPCATSDFCLPAYFTVSARSSSNLCANNDCRRPNQVGYYLEHRGLRCLPLRGTAICQSPILVLIMLSVVISFIIVQ